MNSKEFKFSEEKAAEFLELGRPVAEALPPHRLS